MKRILNGKTYNTETSTKVAFADMLDNSVLDGDQCLYLTRGGDFFIHYVGGISFEVDGDTMAVDRENGEAIWCDPDVGDWTEQYRVTIVDNNLFPGDSDTAGTIWLDQEREKEGTIYLRVPGSLKRRIEDAAKAKSQSVNAWTMRCVENCLPEPTK